MLVLDLAIRVGRIDVVINRLEVARFSRAMHRIDLPNAAYQSMFCVAILPFDQVDLAGVAFVMQAIIQD
jgi:hypothetical protein